MNWIKLILGQKLRLLDCCSRGVGEPLVSTRLFHPAGRKKLSALKYESKPNLNLVVSLGDVKFLVVKGWRLVPVAERFSRCVLADHELGKIIL